MNFDNFNQMLASVQELRKFYPIVRIWDANHNRIHYNENNGSSDEVPVPVTSMHNVTLSIRESENTLEAIIPAAIDGQTYCIELIQHYEKKDDIPSLLHMQKLIITDSLTNLYNRRYINKQLPINLNRAFMQENSVSFIYADIDFFKKINDQYGHIAGDYILCETADIFLQTIRKENGWAARYGGDEFLFCLPDIDQCDAVKIADQIRAAIENKSFCFGRHHIAITCSFGVQTIHKASGVHTVNQVIELLDPKLYKAKKKGKNRIIV